MPPEGIQAMLHALGHRVEDCFSEFTQALVTSLAMETFLASQSVVPRGVAFGQQRRGALDYPVHDLQAA